MKGVVKSQIVRCSDLESVRDELLRMIGEERERRMDFLWKVKGMNKKALEKEMTKLKRSKKTWYMNVIKEEYMLHCDLDECGYGHACSSAQSGVYCPVNTPYDPTGY